MGNSPSNANHSNASHPPDKSEKRHDSPSRRTASPIRGGSPSPSSRVHKSLRHKKKSLELPDLASLALTPASSSPNGSPHNAYRRPRASSPIPIPTSSAAPVQTFRVQNALPSAAHIHISPQRGGRHRSYLSSAYPSTHSMASGDQNSPPRQEHPPNLEFVKEIIHSALPLAIPKAEEDDKRQEPVAISIKWKGGGRSVQLARAGDDNWKGRQPLEYDLATNTWCADVQLLPGTHHFKFIVDDQWRIADDYGTAVDDRDGSLANYINVTIPTSSSPQTSGYVSPLASPHHTHPNQFHSFWSDTSGGDTAGDAANGSGTGAAHAKTDGEWTTVIPPELIQAAAEEENYLANADSPTTSSSVPAPNIPPAPVLPRHLDRLILNVKPTAVTGSPANSVVNGGVDRERDRTSRRSGSTRNHRRGERESRGGGRSNLGMTATLAAGEAADGEPSSPLPVLPVVTASGTDVTAALSHPQTPIDEGIPSSQGSLLAKKIPTAKLDGPGLADDASVLPVPNHVVLHHLSTSAIRNGVLAVANTTRYRKKYITTILYKPT
ncbi:hypothetical protein EIP91_010593 [Steccherinum ochraceum]|uniref:Association with the SNF1 complex (ASC) domain-containing protein n=1 Tax=Steccherinum ochraceum TaxID=92696 RepID=A0A4V2MUX1_9APHY|nr:hypothetical protein EIP91_010593 [Steccherinum ochraceum]